MNLYKTLLLMITIFLLFINCTKNSIFNTIDETKFSSEEISDIDQISKNIVKHFNIPTKSKYVKSSKDGTKIFAISSNKYDLYIIDYNNELVENITLDFTPSEIIVGKNNDYIFVTSFPEKIYGFNGIAKIDLNKKEVIKKYLEPGFFSISAKFSPDYKNIYLSNINNNFITVIDSESLDIIRKIPLGSVGSGFGIDISKDGSLLFVAHGFNQELSLINLDLSEKVTPRKVAKYHFEFRPLYVKVDEEKDWIYILGDQTNTLKIANFKTGQIFKDVNMEKIKIFSRRGNVESFLPFGTIEFIPHENSLVVWNHYLRYPRFINEYGIEVGHLSFEVDWMDYGLHKDYFIFSPSESKSIIAIGINRITEFIID